MGVHIDFDIPATMRDGVVLRANVFRPTEGGPYPVVLVRTPFGKQHATVTPFLDAPRLAQAGYLVVLQDVRGRFASGGEWRPFRQEAEDGDDSVEWCASLAGANGRVGMSGASYAGFAQWAAAMAAPPHLGAILPALTHADAGNGLIRRGGALELGLLAHFALAGTAIDLCLKRHANAPPEEQWQALQQVILEIDGLPKEGYHSLPLGRFAPLERVGALGDLVEHLAHANDRAYCHPLSPQSGYDRVQVPAANIGGWYDQFGLGAADNFNGLRASATAARHSTLLIGPWSHGSGSHVVGEHDFGLAANLAFIDPTFLAQRWFDRWLKGIDNGIEREPPVRLFIMGDDVWRTEHEWPLARARYTAYYLRSGGLSPTPPGDEAPDGYEYDPMNATPLHGGAFAAPEIFVAGVRDQRKLERRRDVLVYTSDRLPHDVEVTGPVIMRLWAASDAPDTDFVARLIDVHPDGFARNLTDGIVRARYRGGAEPALLEPGHPYVFEIDLGGTANVFKAGHRIRVDVASASFPRFDRNPNTGAAIGEGIELRRARQTIFHDAARPSHIVLPIIPR